MNQTEGKAEANASMFKSLWGKPSKPSSTDFIPLFSDCIRLASTRTRECLLFLDPEGKFLPSPAALSEVFLMTYIQRSTQLNLTRAFSCTAMTKEQRILLGADWVWAVLDQPTKNPRIQIAVQVLHLPERGGARAEDFPSEVYTESMQMAKMESANKTKAEMMVEFCARVGRDCYALFLFFGRKNDPGNIYGVLSNNLHAAIGKCARIDRVLVENFLKGSRCFVTPTGMLQTVVSKKEDDPLNMLVKFT